jgi:multidrug efflux pump subunit AcrB
MIVRAGLERLAPVLMTALTAGIALVTLVLAAGEAGKKSSTQWQLSFWEA